MHVKYIHTIIIRETHEIFLPLRMQIIFGSYVRKFHAMNNLYTYLKNTGLSEDQSQEHCCIFTCSLQVIAVSEVASRILNANRRHIHT